MHGEDYFLIAFGLILSWVAFRKLGGAGEGFWGLMLVIGLLILAVAATKLSGDIDVLWMIPTWRVK